VTDYDVSIFVVVMRNAVVVVDLRRHHLLITKLDISRLTPTDRATRCVTPNPHRAVHKARRWV